MPKKAGMEAWKKNDARNIWKRKNSDKKTTQGISGKERIPILYIL